MNYVLWFLGRIEFNYDFEYRSRCKNGMKIEEGIEFKCNPCTIIMYEFNANFNHLIFSFMNNAINQLFKEIAKIFIPNKKKKFIHRTAKN